MTKKLTRKKSWTAKQRNAAFKPTYIFGYGSLLLPKGINGRGMAKRYNWKDLATVRLDGYARSMTAFFGGRNFYGLLEDSIAHCNGVVFKIENWYDYRAFLLSEGAISAFKETRTYWPIDVTKQISEWKVPKNHRVVTLFCHNDKSNWGRVERGYIRLCHEGAAKWGENFETEFLNTGGVPFNGRTMKEISKTFNIKLW